ncbi:MAG: CHAD domain-containing protein [Anaerolineae bacterium]|nr:CHAD domain-containing protein [Anaerolineae bacterium]
MNDNPDTLLDELHEHEQPLSGDDVMAEAGRKVMLRQLIQIVESQSGVIAGEDPEAVHDMRVATRRIRSTFRLLERYYKPKIAASFERRLKELARMLGAVRDHDVLLEQVSGYRGTLQQDDSQRQALDALIERIGQERAVARYHLLKLLEKKRYHHFIQAFATFTTTPKDGARKINDSGVEPIQVRHALPPLIYAHLAAVRAYDDILSEATDEQLHALRIEFKRLRYASTLFDEVLGSQIKDFNKELAAFQNQLGRMQDMVTAKATITGLLPELPADSGEGLQPYLESLSLEQESLRGDIGAMWKKFNSKPVMGKLGGAVAAL